MRCAVAAPLTACQRGGCGTRFWMAHWEDLPRTLINSVGPEEANRRSSVDKLWVPHDHLRNVSGTLLALKVIPPTLVGPLRANVQAIDQRSRRSNAPCPRQGVGQGSVQPWWTDANNGRSVRRSPYEKARGLPCRTPTLAAL